MINTDMGKLVADAGFKGPPTAAGDVEIGYGTVKVHEGKGYATEAATALVRWAFADVSVRAVIAECESDNHRSARVLAKIGMCQVGKRGSKLLWRIERPEA